MMMTGDDTVLLAHGNVSAAVGDFLSDLTGRWPEVRVSVEGDGDEQFRRWASAGVRLPDESGLILIARDEQMEAEWDDGGYTLDAFGEGPLCIEYRPANWSTLNVQVLEDPLSREGFKFEPYDAILAGPRYYVVSMVTPPRDSEFSLEMVRQAGAFPCSPIQLRRASIVRLI